MGHYQHRRDTLDTSEDLGLQVLQQVQGLAAVLRPWYRSFDERKPQRLTSVTTSLLRISLKNERIEGCDHQILPICHTFGVTALSLISRVSLSIPGRADFV
jgi:hypothetical protein